MRGAHVTDVDTRLGAVRGVKPVRQDAGPITMGPISSGHQMSRWARTYACLHRGTFEAEKAATADAAITDTRTAAAPTCGEWRRPK